MDELGSNAYSVFTDPNGLNMEDGKYYLTNTKGVSGETFNKMMLYLKDNSITFVDDTPYRAVVRCILKIPKVNLVAPFSDRDLEFNVKISVNIDNNKYIVYSKQKLLNINLLQGESIKSNIGENILMAQIFIRLYSYD